jgi:hypothetical protein
MRVRNREEPPCLLAALEQAQAEMRRDQAKRPGGGCNLDLDGTARLALEVGDVVNLAPAQRPAAYHGLSVFAIGGADRFRVDAMIADSLAQNDKGGPCGGLRASGIHFLQRHHVRTIARDDLDHTCQIESAIGADPAVDVPGHDAETRGAVIQCRASASAGARPARRSKRRATPVPPG